MPGSRFFTENHLFPVAWTWLLLSGIIVWSAGCESKAQETGTPLGWASYRREVTGGEGGPVIRVSDRQQLIRALDGSGRVILIHDTIRLHEGERIDVGGDDLTLEGEGSYAMLQNGGLNLLGSNIIIRNLSIGDSYQNGHWRGKGDPTTDAITIYGTHVWIDHCELFHSYDGLLDVSSKGPGETGDLITVSWTRFFNHNKVMLIGSNDGCTVCAGKHRVTVHHCWFDGTSRFYDPVDDAWYRIQQRMPRVRYGDVHVLNNYYEDVGDYAIAARFESSVFAEGNYFRNLRDPHIIDDLGKGRREPELVASDNIYDNVKGERSVRGDAFIPGEYYRYRTDPATDVPGKVMNHAGKFNRKNNRDPVAKADYIEFYRGEKATLPLIENDTDPDGDSLRIAVVSLPEELEITTFPEHITLKSDLPGTYSGTYTLIDYQGGEAAAEIHVVVK